jgi:hypothetical protein
MTINPNSRKSDSSMAGDCLPFGVDDLDSNMQVDLGPPKRIRCFARGCEHWLCPPSRQGGGQVCPDHGIRCHSSGTYSYADLGRNLIIDADMFSKRVIGHPFKYETSRFNQENSEDAVTWNVFRSLQRAGCLQDVANEVTGLDLLEEPQLFLWGLALSGDTFEPWKLLIDARRRFESDLPVRRPLTEPDIALYSPGKYLILIEAKLTSSNPVYTDGPRKSSSSLTKSELLDIYWDDELMLLDRKRAQAVDRVHYQFWRNLVFAEWMACQKGNETPAYLGSLTRRGYETESCREFGELLGSSASSRFAHISWEQIVETCGRKAHRLAQLNAYAHSKTANLRKCFRL